MNKEDANVNYKEMYLIMVRASEKAIRCLQDKGDMLQAENHLISAQLKCEEMYIEAD